jgi:hypothetical protein
MGLLRFIKEAGEKLFYHDAAAAATLSEDQLKTANGRAADAIKSHVEAHELKATGLMVTYAEQRRVICLRLTQRVSLYR